LVTPWCTWWDQKAILNSFQLMVLGSSWASTYASRQSTTGPVSWCKASNTFSQLLHWTTSSFFSTVLGQSSTSMGSMELEKVGSLVRWKSPSLSVGGGGGAWGWAFCLLTMVYCMVWSIWACIMKTCTRVGGGLAALLFSALLFSALFSVLMLRFLVLTIWRIDGISKKKGWGREIMLDKENRK
jgi:hypothetical protein